MSLNVKSDCAIGRSLCDFLLVPNGNYMSVFHRLGVLGICKVPPDFFLHWTKLSDHTHPPYFISGFGEKLLPKMKLMGGILLILLRYFVGASTHTHARTHTRTRRSIKARSADLAEFSSDTISINTV